MACGAILFFQTLITLVFALFTYRIIISANTVLKQDLPGRSASSHIFIDPVIQKPRPGDGSSDAKRTRLFHTAVTASGDVYSAWQCRVMFYWFQKVRASAVPGSSEMGGFTRILHSGHPDQYMDEIPTFVAQPLPAGLDRGYVVLHRPWAFVQWLLDTDIKEDYILMAEPDHLILKPIPNLSNDGFGAAFQFSYIKPKKNEKLLRMYYPEERGPITNIDPIGNSPVIIGKDVLKKIAPTWMNVSLAMKQDPETDKAFGWVLEMYAYAVSCALHNVSNILHKDFMIQPPWDTEVRDKYILHYTFACNYDMKGQLTYGTTVEWSFDKRSYVSPPPRNLTMPPPGVPQSVVTLVKMINEATANIPDWESWRESETQFLF